MSWVYIRWTRTRYRSCECEFDYLHLTYQHTAKLQVWKQPQTRLHCFSWHDLRLHLAASIIKSTVGLHPLKVDSHLWINDFSTLSWCSDILNSGSCPWALWKGREGNVNTCTSFHINRKWEICSCQIDAEKKASRYDGKKWQFIWHIKPCWITVRRVLMTILF